MPADNGGQARRVRTWRIGGSVFFIVAIVCTYLAGGGAWFFAGMCWGYLGGMWVMFADPDRRS